MARHKNQIWELPEKLTQYDQAQLAVMMDIRDELKTLNQLLHCYKFKEFPAILKRIDKRIARKVKL